MKSPTSSPPGGQVIRFQPGGERGPSRGVNSAPALLSEKTISLKPGHIRIGGATRRRDAHVPCTPAGCGPPLGRKLNGRSGKSPPNPVRSTKRGPLSMPRSTRTWARQGFHIAARCTGWERNRKWAGSSRYRFREGTTAWRAATSRCGSEPYDLRDVLASRAAPRTVRTRATASAGSLLRLRPGWVLATTDTTTRLQMDTAVLNQTGANANWVLRGLSSTWTPRTALAQALVPFLSPRSWRTVQGGPRVRLPACACT